MNLIECKNTKKRNPNEIGFSSIRGGNIVGEHSVMFFLMTMNVLKLSTSLILAVFFAEGALKAAEFILKQHVGYYSSI